MLSCKLTTALREEEEGKMIDLVGLYSLAEQDGITVDCFDLHSRQALSIMDIDGSCHIAIDPFQLCSEAD